MVAIGNFRPRGDGGRRGEARVEPSVEESVAESAESGAAEPATTTEPPAAVERGTGERAAPAAGGGAQ